MKRVFPTLIKVRNIRIVLALGLLTFAITHGLTNWLPKMFEANGFSPTMAGYASSVPLLAGIPSLLVLPRLIPPLRRSCSLAGLAVIIALSVWIFFSRQGTLMFIGLLFFGVSSCALVPLLTLILMDAPEVGSKYMGSASGLFFCISEIGGFMSPLVIGILVDWTGDFLAGGYFVIALSLAIFLMSFLIQNTTVRDAESF
jgi:cyanate permease